MKKAPGNRILEESGTWKDCWSFGTYEFVNQAISNIIIYKEGETKDDAHQVFLHDHTCTYRTYNWEWEAYFFLLKYSLEYRLVIWSM